MKETVFVMKWCSSLSPSGPVTPCRWSSLTQRLPGRCGSTQVMLKIQANASAGKHRVGDITRESCHVRFRRCPGLGRDFSLQAVRTRVQASELHTESQVRWCALGSRARQIPEAHTGQSNQRAAPTPTAYSDNHHHHQSAWHLRQAAPEAALWPTHAHAEPKNLGKGQKGIPSNVL